MTLTFINEPKIKREIHIGNPALIDVYRTLLNRYNKSKTTLFQELF